MRLEVVQTDLFLSHLCVCVYVCTHTYTYILSIVCVSVFYLHACLCTMCVHGAQRVQKRASDALRLELQMDMNMWVLGMETMPSGRLASDLNQ